MTTMTEDALQTLAREVGSLLIERGEHVATAESCTGGLIAKLLTDIAGSSEWFERGLVTYSNASKSELLGVSRGILDTAGAVSNHTVRAMADGLLQRAPVQWTVAVSGVAGPGGGSADKPVGTVWIAWAGRGIATSASRFGFDGDRAAVRCAAAAAALGGLRDLLAPFHSAASRR